MEDETSLEVRLVALANRRRLLGILGITASMVAAVMLGAARTAQAQETKPPAKPPPRRRGIFSAPPRDAPSSSKAFKAEDGEGLPGVPGGLPGARPKPDPVPGGVQRAPHD